MTPGSRRQAGAVQFAGLILAGGIGRRFGGPKAFARLPDGRTFLEACRDALRAAGASVVAGTLPHGATHEEFAGLRSLPLPEPGLDMLASVRWGLRHLISDRTWESVVVLPVDHPLVAPETVLALVGRRVAAAVPAYRGKHGHPICVARGVAERVAREQLVGRDLRDILKTVGVVDVAVEDAGVIANCNTPEALRDHLLRASRLGRP